jgi:hypothetical protein
MMAGRSVVAPTTQPTVEFAGLVELEALGQPNGDVVLRMQRLCVYVCVVLVYVYNEMAAKS